MQKPVAVTGATGFVGGHLLAALLASGQRVRVLVRDVARLSPEIERDNDLLEIVEGDLDDGTALEKLLTGAGAVIHCAGAIAALNGQGFFKVNQTGAENVAKAAVAAGVERFIHVSSLTAREPHLSDYAASKQAGEDSVAANFPQENLIIVRPPAIYGPGDKETLRLIRALTKPVAILPGRADQKISLMYVCDLADLLVHLVDSKQGGGAVFEVDDGRTGGYGFQEIVELAAKAQDRTMPLVLLPRLLVGLAGVVTLAAAKLFGKPAVLSPAKVRELYHSDWAARGALIKGWQAKVQFGEGFGLTLDWYRQNGWLPASGMRVKSRGTLDNGESLE